jgi:uncharacterized protein (TIGR02996 family)
MMPGDAEPIELPDALPGVAPGSEEDRLLRGCLLAPEDDLARLAYADWLEENGRPDHADLIRNSFKNGTIVPV